MGEKFAKEQIDLVAKLAIADSNETDIAMGQLKETLNELMGVLNEEKQKTN